METKEMTFDKKVIDRLLKNAGAAYPKEGCGLLLGNPEENIVMDVCIMKNLAAAKREKGCFRIYLSEIGMLCVYRWEHELLTYALKEMKHVKGIHLIGTALHKASALAFKLEGYSDEEVGKRLDAYGIAVRTGHHCAQPVLRRFGYESAVRPTIALYNSPDDIDALVRALKTFA